MASRVNHARANARARARIQGIENIHDYGLPGGLEPPRARRSKADMRAELDAAVGRITRHVRCRCGHSGEVIVPTAKDHARLRCSRCGNIAS